MKPKFPSVIFDDPNYKHFGMKDEIHIGGTSAKTDNELIAEFMGHDVPKEYLNGSSLNSKYDTSWDWLMPVVEKIDDLDDGKYIVTIEPMITIISNQGEAPIVECQVDSRIENTYKAVVEFIKWYNHETNENLHPLPR